MTNDHVEPLRPGDLAPDAHEQVVRAISRMLADILDISPELITSDALLLELGAQSFDFVDLVVRLEKAYGVTIAPVYAIPDRHTVESYVRAVTEARNGNGTGAQTPEPLGGS